MRPFFPHCTIEYYQYTENEEYDVYGEPIVSYEKAGECICDFQPLSSKDSQMMFGKILNDTFKLFIEYNIPVTDKMMIKKKDEPKTYMIVGGPLRYDHFLRHQEMTVQKTRKPWQI